MSAQPSNYRRPPIVEAVIDVQVADDISVRQLERVRDKLKSRYRTIETTNIVEVAINGTSVVPRMTVGGFKMTSAAGTDIVALSLTGIGTIRLAPYLGWENLAETARLNFMTFADAVGRPTPNRVSTRFINRIDIPHRQAPIDPRKYVVVGAAMPPDGEGSLVAENAHVEFDDAPSGLRIVLNTSIAPPALLDHMSYMVDIDLLQLKDIPLKYEDLWKRIDELRPIKNRLFESFITDQARQLFQ